MELDYGSKKKILKYIGMILPGAGKELVGMALETLEESGRRNLKKLEGTGQEQQEIN